MSNREKYTKEISILRREIPKYVELSLIVGALTFLAGRGFLSIVPHDISTSSGRVMDLMLSYGLPLLTWHTFYNEAENKMSQMKQKIREANLYSSIEYTKFEKFINATMIFHDNSSLP